MSAPDLSRKVVGFREWQLSGHWLASLGVQGLWGRGVNVARCTASPAAAQYAQLLQAKSAAFAMSGSVPPDPPKGHEAPGHRCQCGLYGLHRIPSQYLGGPPYAPAANVVGAILAWGRVEVHRTGFRSQFAEIVALGYRDQDPLGYVEAVGKFAEGYAVPAVPVSDLEEFALTLGDRIPKSLFPGREKRERPPDPVQQQAGSVQRYQPGGLTQAIMAQQNQAAMSHVNVWHTEWGFPSNEASFRPSKRKKWWQL